jgi:hypothetical protein
VRPRSPERFLRPCPAMPLLPPLVRTSVRAARCTLPIALLALSTGCAAVEHVTPWLSIETTRPILDIPHVLRTGPAYERHVHRLGPGGWTELADAGSALALDGGRRALLSELGPQRNVILDETGRVVATLPCATWVTPDRRRIVCLDEPGPTEEDPSKRMVRLRVFSDAGAPLSDDTAPALATSHSVYSPHGIIAIIGLRSTGEVVLREVHMPASGDFGAPRLARLFVLRAHQLVLIAERTAAPDEAYDAGSWDGRLPEGWSLRAGSGF